ncbi:hypothetical protein ABZ208_17360 [Streptomyces sp. NPDC006208]|uniref:hypothetical protein n=1 Tax=Streptomyces sp. NPDC006208 TaxID=3156734 RepID=UPI0033BB8255
MRHASTVAGSIDSPDTDAPVEWNADGDGPSAAQRLAYLLRGLELPEQPIVCARLQERYSGRAGSFATM